MLLIKKVQHVSEYILHLNCLHLITNDLFYFSDVAALFFERTARASVTIVFFSFLFLYEQKIKTNHG